MAVHYVNEDELIALKELEDSLEHLGDAWKECLCIFSDARIDVNDYILGDEVQDTAYPFHRSFDELNVLPWIEGVLKAIEDKKGGCGYD